MWYWNRSLSSLGKSGTRPPQGLWSSVESEKWTDSGCSMRKWAAVRPANERIRAERILNVELTLAVRKAGGWWYCDWLWREVEAMGEQEMQWRREGGESRKPNLKKRRNTRSTWERAGSGRNDCTDMKRRWHLPGADEQVSRNGTTWTAFQAVWGSAAGARRLLVIELACIDSDD